MRQGMRVSRLLRGLALAAALLFAAPAQAAVTITFYSHEFRLLDGQRTDFPHGFVALTGTTDSGEAVNTDFGFSATTIYALALLIPLDGALDNPSDYTPDYIAEAMPHFAFPLSDAQYQAVLATVEKWRNAPQPSYDFYSRNCVTFVSDVAVAAGLTVTTSKKFIHDPRGFLDDTALRNRAFLAQYGNLLQEAQSPAAVNAAAPVPAPESAPRSASAPPL
jgi:hypothetical protein